MLQLSLQRVFLTTKIEFWPATTSGLEFSMLLLGDFICDERKNFGYLLFKLELELKINSLFQLILTKRTLEYVIFVQNILYRWQKNLQD